MFDSQETNRLRFLVSNGAVLDKSTVLDMLTELEARGNKVVNLEKSIHRVRELVADFQANGNSRGLGDPTATTWHDAATQILKALDGETNA